MIGTNAVVTTGSPGRSAGRRVRADTLLYAILVQLGLLLVTVFIVVLHPSATVDPAFEGKSTIRLPQRELEHRVALAEFQQMAASPMQTATGVLSSSSPTKTTSRISTSMLMSDPSRWHPLTPWSVP